MLVRDITIHDYRDRWHGQVEHERLIAIRLGDFLFNLNIEEAEDLFDKLGMVMVGMTADEVEEYLKGLT